MISVFSDDMRKTHELTVYLDDVRPRMDGVHFNSTKQIVILPFIFNLSIYKLKLSKHFPFQKKPKKGIRTNEPHLLVTLHLQIRFLDKRTDWIINWNSESQGLEDNIIVYDYNVEL